MGHIEHMRREGLKGTEMDRGKKKKQTLSADSLDQEKVGTRQS